MTVRLMWLVVFGFLSLGWFVADGRSDKKRKAEMSTGGIPWIREVKPSSARIGDKIKIEGENFGPETPIVTFNGVEAVIKKIKFDELNVVVPQRATTGPLIVIVGGRRSNLVRIIIREHDDGSPARTTSKPADVIVKPDSGSPAQSNATGVISFSKNIQPIFDRNCTNCHGGSADLFLDEGESHASLVNVQATKGCTSEKRVLPGNSSASVLFKRISGTSCGTQMPKKSPPLSANEIRLIGEWIEQGASNN